ncbi:MAG: hypothetical protein V4476_19510 [Pseudomonadota bacterium]
MTVELILGGGNLLALIGYFIRTENRLTRLETKLDFMLSERNKP